MYIYVYMHCIFICGLSDVIIKTFSQSVSIDLLMHWSIQLHGYKSV